MDIQGKGNVYQGAFEKLVNDIVLLRATACSCPRPLLDLYHLDRLSVFLAFVEHLLRYEIKSTGSDDDRKRNNFDP